MSDFIRKRRQLRSRIRADSSLDQRLHLFASLMLVLNMILILYAVFSIAIRMTLSGVALLDSLPVGLYILPLMIILPLLVRAYYRERFAPFNFAILLISSIIFGVLSVLVRIFILFSVLNALALVLIFLMGRFRPESSLREIGPRGCAIFLIFNLLGLMFPITTIAMGANPIAVNPVNTPDHISLSVPLADFDFPYTNLTPCPSLLQELEDEDYSLDLHVLEGNANSILRLRDWLTCLNSTSIEYTLTMTAPRETFVSSNYTIGTDMILGAVYASHTTALEEIMDMIESLNMSRLPNRILYDMTLSDVEWSNLMEATRNLNLVSFGTLIRNLVDSVNSSMLDSAARLLANATREVGLAAGVLVEPFVLDDLQDSDTLVMRACGLSAMSLGYWDIIEVSCSRSRFSLEMNGDVGEYLVHSYSRSILPEGFVRNFNPNWSLRLGTVGNGTDVLGRQNSGYTTLDSIVVDIASSGGAVESITIESLPMMIQSLGEAAPKSLRDALEALDSARITYTFRIYAFRAVFIAIDSFDSLML